jgi:NTP pyrophosphatase (non-canonical NTP hydrolase)
VSAPVLVGLDRNKIWLDIITERLRQEELCASGKFNWTLAHAGQFTLADGLVVLAEEFGEVAKEVCDSGFGNGGPPDLSLLRTELVQLAACCVAWVEGIDAYSDEEIAERAAATQRSTPQPTHNID